MNVLTVYRTCLPFSMGGLEQVIRFLTEGTSKLGVNNRIIVLSDDGGDSVDVIHGVEIYRYKKNFEISSNGFSLGLLCSFGQHKKWADIVHYHYPWPTGDLLHMIYRPKRTVVTYHSDIVKQKFLKLLYAPLEKLFLDSLDRIVATSPNYLSTSSNLKIRKSKCSVIPLGIDEDLQTSVKPTEISGLPENFFLFVGVLRYYKGLDILLDAAKIAGYPVVIAGDGPLRENLDRRIRDESINNVFRVGRVSDSEKKYLLEHCYAFVFSSHLRSEAFGVSLLEAQIFSKALLTCDVGTGSSYVNIDGLTGIVVKPNDAAELANGMKTLIDDAGAAKKMGSAGRKRYEELFTNSEMSRMYFDLYSSMLS